MKTNKLLTVMTAIGIAVALMSCEGKQGAPGATGPQGPAGTNGLNGNANVLTQTWNIPSWNNNGSIYYVNLSDINVTSAIQSMGTVEAFLSTDAGTTWRALPFTQYVSGSSNYFMDYYTTVGNVQITWTQNSPGLGSDPNTYYSATCQIKDVCIAGSIMKQHPKTNWKDYGQVQAILEAQKANNN